MFPVLSLRKKYWKNGTQFMGRIVNSAIGERNYEYARMQKRIFYVHAYYLKQSILNKLSHEAPDVVNAFSVLNKEDMSHGFPQRRPFERNSDFTQYNMNSESWFQFWSLMGSLMVVSYWYWTADHYYFVSGVSWEDEDNFRLKDAKQVIHWERTIWNLTFQVHGQHMSAFCRHFKFYTNHPDDPKLNYRPSYNIKNPYAPDRYYKGYGNMRNVRLM